MPLAQSDHKDPRVTRGRPDLRDQLVPRDRPVPLVLRGLKVLKVILVTSDPRDLLVRILLFPVRRDLKVILVI